MKNIEKVFEIVGTEVKPTYHLTRSLLPYEKLEQLEAELDCTFSKVGDSFYGRQTYTITYDDKYDFDFELFIKVKLDDDEEEIRQLEKRLAELKGETV